MPTETTVHEAAVHLRMAGRVTIFTGAGASAGSGIPTFRDSGGLWEEFPPEQFANWRALLAATAQSPAELARFLIALLGPIANARPNPAHRAIANLETHVHVTV